MTTLNLLELRGELFRIKRVIRDELRRTRPDHPRVLDLRRHENACADRLGKAIAKLRAAERRHPARSRGAGVQQGAAL